MSRKSAAKNVADAISWHGFSLEIGRRAEEKSDADKKIINCNFLPGLVVDQLVRLQLLIGRWEEARDVNRFTCSLYDDNGQVEYLPGTTDMGNKDPSGRSAAWWAADLAQGSRLVAIGSRASRDGNRSVARHCEPVDESSLSSRKDGNS